MSATALAKLLDQLHKGKRAHLSEREEVVTASKLSVADARDILDLCGTIGWAAEARDKADDLAAGDSLTDSFGPYVVYIRKAAGPAGVLRLLTGRGLEYFVRAGHAATRWQIALLSAPIRTRGILYLPWDSDEPYEPAPRFRNPRSLVQDFGPVRSVPDDVRPWLLADGVPAWFDDPMFPRWADAAANALLRSLPDEIDPEDGRLRFRGPPRLALTLPANVNGMAASLGQNGFSELQDAMRWVFGDDAKVEMRHVLLAAEIALSGRDGDAASCVAKHIAASLQGAKIAYQVALSEVSRDTLKLLADLRKAITEETAKVTEASRQIVTAVAGALAVGLGLLAARVAAAADPWLINGVMVLTAFYVLMVALAGQQFVDLQADLRKDWQSQLYRFLPDHDYDRMVTKPAERAERVLAWAAGLGVGAVTILMLVVLLADRGPGSGA